MNHHNYDVEESYSCPQCFRVYRRSGTLRRHLRHECGKGKSMVCSVCGHRTKRADHLLQHVRKRHPDIANRYSNRTITTTASSLVGETNVTTVSNPITPPIVLPQMANIHACNSNKQLYQNATIL